MLLNDRQWPSRDSDYFGLEAVRVALSPVSYQTSLSIERVCRICVPATPDGLPRGAYGLFRYAISPLTPNTR